MQSGASLLQYHSFTSFSAAYDASNLSPSNSILVTMMATRKQTDLSLSYAFVLCCPRHVRRANSVLHCSSSREPA